MQTPPNRIIFVPFIDAFGGAERLILDLSQLLYRHRIRHTLTCFNQTIDLQSYADWPLEIHNIRSPRNFLAESLALARFLKSKQRRESGLPLLFDLKGGFYSGVRSAGPFIAHVTDSPTLLPADISKYSFSARSRIEEFENLPRPEAWQAMRGELVHRINRRGLRKAAKVLVMTEKIRRELHQLYQVDSLVLRPGVSPNGIPSRTVTASGNSLRILSVSRLEPSKRIDWILRALAKLHSTHSFDKVNWSLEIVGDGPASASLKALTIELGLAERTSFLGHLSDEELAKSYSRANLFLMPAVQGYGLPALEALQRGIPTIVHEDSGVSEILGQSPWAEIVDGNNGSLSKAIERMVGHIYNKRLLVSEKPKVPTNIEWARQVCIECGWLPA
jgi:glycosyltransferase involved in cell wall biosynthesis